MSAKKLKRYTKAQAQKIFVEKAGLNEFYSIDMASIGLAYINRSDSAIERRRIVEAAAAEVIEIKTRVLDGQGTLASVSREHLAALDARLDGLGSGVGSDDDSGGEGDD